jgi:hypothetical protein
MTDITLQIILTRDYRSEESVSFFASDP